MKSRLALRKAAGTRTRGAKRCLQAAAMTRRLREVVRRKSGGAVAERGAAGDARFE